MGIRWGDDVNGANESFPTGAHEQIRFGVHHLDVTARRLTRDGHPVSLAPRAFELLVALARGRDRALSRAELIDAVWGETIVEEGNLAWTIKELRRALGEDGEAVETVRGFGYRFSPRAPLGESATVSEGVPEEGPEDLVSASPGATPLTTRRTLVRLGFGTLAALTLAFGWWALESTGRRGPQPTPPTALDRLADKSDLPLALAHEQLALEALVAGAELRARDHAQRAFELAERDDTAHSAADRLRLAGRAAVTSGDWIAARVAFEELAAEHTIDLEVGLLLAEVRSRLGDFAEAEAELDRLAAHAGHDEARIDLERGWNAWRAGDPRAARSAADRAAAIARRGERTRELAAALVLQATVDRALGALDSGRAACESATVSARDGGLGKLELEAGIACGWLWLGEGTDQARSWFTDTLSLARERGSRSQTAAALIGLATISLTEGGVADTTTLAYEALGVARDARDIEQEANALRLLSLTARLGADLDSAERWAREGLDRAKALPLASRLTLLAGELGRARIERGDATGAAAAFAEAARAELAPSESSRALAQVSLGWARLVGGDSSGAQALAEAALQRLGELPSPATVEAWALLAESSAAAGDRNAAARATAWLRQLPPSRAALDAGWILALARAEAASGEVQSARRRLRALLDDPATSELVLLQLEAELRLAELDGDTRRAAAARARAGQLGVGRLGA